MKKGTDFSTTFNGLYVVHQNLPSKKTKPHLFSEHILFIPLAGDLKIKMLNAELSVGTGYMAYLPPNTHHEFIASDHGGERLIVMFKEKLAGNFTEPKKLPLSQLLKEIVFYLLIHPSTKSANSLTLVFTETLSELLQANISSESPLHLMGRVRDPRLKKALSFLEVIFPRKSGHKIYAANASFS